MWLFYHTYLLLKLLSVNKALYLRKAKKISEALLHFSRKPQRVLFI